MMDWFRIIYELKCRGLTHDQQAKEVDVCRKTIENWSMGRGEPPYSKAEQLLTVFRSVVGSTG